MTQAKNERLLLLVTFMAKYDLIFVLTQENAYFILKSTEIA